MSKKQARAGVGQGGSQSRGQSGGAGVVRIIGGVYKRSRLPVADLPGLRPTADRVRETLFNWLGQDLTGWRCLDAFAGSGALGFEAASRGAARVLMLEREARAVALLRQTIAKLGVQTVQVQQGEAVAVMASLVQSQPAGFEAVFLDPPFDSGLHEQALRAARPLLAPAGLLYLEAGQAWQAARLLPLGLVLLRHLKAGAVHAHLCEAAA